MFAVTWIRQQLGTTPDFRSFSRLHLSIPSLVLRSMPTPSATQHPLRNHKTSIQMQVSLLLHPPTSLSRHTELPYKVQLHRQWVRSLLGVVSSGFLFGLLLSWLWCLFYKWRDGTLSFEILVQRPIKLREIFRKNSGGSSSSC